MRWLGFCAAGIALVQMACLKNLGQEPSPPPTDTSAVIEQPFLSSYEGQIVSSIQIAGRPDFDASSCARCFAQQAGQPFSREKVDQSAGAIRAAGKFDSVEIQAEPDAQGVRVIFVVKPAVYFGIFEFPGAEKQFPYSQLTQAANSPLSEAFNSAEVAADQQSLLTFFEQEGYFGAHVTPAVDLDSSNALGNVLFDSPLGKRAKFGAIDIENAPEAEAPALEHRLAAWPARFRAAAIRPGKTYHHSTLNRATKYLQNTLEKQGYLGAQVKLSGAEYQAPSNRADIHFSVNAGSETEVQISGAHLWPWTRDSLLPIYQGVAVDDETVTEGRQALISYFEGKGFFDVAVDSQLNKGAKTDTVVYRITKNKKHKVTAINLAGNTTLPSSTLLPKVTVEKKHLFSAGKFSDQMVQASVDNLKAVYASEGFSSVKVTSAVARAGGNVQITFRVVEGPRDIVNSLSVEGANTFPQSQFAPNGLKLAAGQPYSQVHVQQDRAGIIANYLKAGYLMASVRETASAVSKSDPHRINVIYHITEGPRVVAGNVITLGRQHTRQELIDRDIAAIKTGQPLTESELLTAGSKLYDHTGVFDWAEVDPKEPVTTQTSDDVLVKVHEAKRNEFTYGFGFEVIERGGSIPSGTVALPNLPPIGLPSTLPPAKPPSMARAALSNTREIICSAKASRFPSPDLPAGSISAGRSITLILISDGRRGRQQPRFLTSATRRTRFFRRSRNRERSSSSTLSTRNTRPFSSRGTHSARSTSPGFSFPLSCPLRISMCDCRRFQQT